MCFLHIKRPTREVQGFERDQKKRFFFNMIWNLLVIIICLSPTPIGAQLSDCNFQELDLLPCLATASENTTNACCLALNQTLNAGHNCLCSILSYTNLQLTSANTLFPASPLEFNLPGCALISVSLASCGIPFELDSPPVTNKQPVLNPTAAMSSSTNSTQDQISKSPGPTFAHKSYTEVNGVSPETHKSFASFVWIISIFAWMVQHVPSEWLLLLGIM